jgi:DNA-binding transcriptional MerR regulator
MARSGAEEKLYKIGEVCRMADVQPYVLRYWETEFPQLAPNKSGGGQRLYNQREIDVILRIKDLLYKEGFTIAGAKKKLEAEQNAPAVEASAVPVPDNAPAASRAKGDPGAKVRKKALAEMKRELQAILKMLDE